MNFKYKLKNPDKQERIKNSKNIIQNSPGKVPVIIEKNNLSKDIPEILMKTVISRNERIATIFCLLKKNLKLSGNQALFLIANGKIQLTMEMELGKVYEDYKDDDGFLYLTYSSEEVYG